MNNRSGMGTNTEQLAHQVGVRFGTRTAAGQSDVHSFWNKEHQLQDSKWLVCGKAFRVSWSLLLLYRINSQLLLPMMLLLLSNHELK